jgi:broad specificity phosphatase PhoE
VGHLYIARHGETDWNRVGRWQGQTDTRLNDVGRSQAKELASMLAGHRINRVISSNLARAHETATIVSELLGLGAVESDEDLRERSYGCFEGLTREECIAQFPEAWQSYLVDRRAGPRGSEPYDQVFGRMKRAMERAASAMIDGQSILLVSHGGAIRTWLSTTTGQPALPIGNGAVLRIACYEGRFEHVATLERAAV